MSEITFQLVRNSFLIIYLQSTLNTLGGFCGVEGMNEVNHASLLCKIDKTMNRLHKTSSCAYLQSSCLFISLHSILSEQLTMADFCENIKNTGCINLKPDFSRRHDANNDKACPVTLQNCRSVSHFEI